MKIRCRLWLCLLLLGFAVAQSPEPRPLSPVEFAQEIGRVRTLVAALEQKPQFSPALIGALPKNWIVKSHHGEMKVSADFVRDGVAAFQKADPNSKISVLKGLESSLELLRSQSSAYDEPSPVPGDARQKLNRILAAREFRGLRGPSRFQLLWQRALSWMEKKFEKLFPSMPSATTAGPIFAWCVIALVCCAFGVWLYRRSREVELQAIREVIPFAPGSKGWRSWLKDARENADRGAWRDAIHLAFWAGVSKLESEGTWRPDRARTPREYLRAIPEWNSARPAFQLVMQSFERSWYGSSPASAEDFQQILAALERMGCR